MDLVLKSKLTEFKLTVPFCKRKVVLLVGMQCYENWHWWTSYVILTVENADICSCMYMRKVSLDQHPIFLMVLGSIPCKCMAMAPPALKLWLSTKSWCRPLLTKLGSVTADFTPLLMSFAKMTCPLQEEVWKYVLMIVFGFDVLARMWCSQQIRARIGQNSLWIASWWITWDQSPFFWL